MGVKFQQNEIVQALNLLNNQAFFLNKIQTLKEKSKIYILKWNFSCGEKEQKFFSPIH